jgi:sugar lactone lactonase YvrE
MYAGSAISISSTSLSTDASELTLKKLKLTIKNNTTDSISEPRLIVDKLVTDAGSLDLREFANVATIVGPGSGPADGPGPSVTISQPTGLARDTDGSFYLAGSGDGTLRRLKDGFVTRIATGIASPGGVAVQGGSVFTLEQSLHNLVRVPVTGGTKFVMAGNGTSGLVDGSGAAARFNAPRDLQMIGSTAFISDFGNDRIRTATNLAGGSATVATLNVFPLITGPSGLGYLSLGGVDWLVVTSTQTHKIYLVNSTNGQSFIIAGTGVTSSVDGPGTTATFNTPYDATVSNGAIFVSDLGGRVIRQLSLTEGALPQFASSWVVKTVAGLGTSGSVDGPGTTAQFASPRFLATDGSGAILVSDLTNNRTRKVTAASGVYPITGSGGGSTGSVSVVTPDGFVPDPAVTVNRKPYFDLATLSPAGAAGDSLEQEIEFAVGQSVTTFSFIISLSGAGTSGGLLDGVVNLGEPGRGSPNVNVRTLTGSVDQGFFDGSPMAARFAHPYLAEANGVFYVADLINGAIRRFDPETGVTSTIAGVARTGITAGGTGTTSRIVDPIDIWVNEAETEGYVLTFNPDVILRLSRLPLTNPNDSNSWTVSIIAGAVNTQGMTNGTGDVARFENPRGFAVDSSGSVIFVADNNNQIRRVAITGGLDRNVAANWFVTLVAGSPTGSIGHADGFGNAALFTNPSGITWAADGNLYVVEIGGNCVRRISPSFEVTTIAGPADNANGLVDGLGSAARFSGPNGICVDDSGYAYISDAGNAMLRRVNLQTGEVRSVAGWSDGLGAVDGSGATCQLGAPRSPVYVPGRGVYVGGSSSIRLVERIVRQ